MDSETKKSIETVFPSPLDSLYNGRIEIDVIIDKKKIELERIKADLGGLSIRREQYEDQIKRMEKELSDQKPLPPNPAHLPATSSNLLQHATSVATTALKDKKKFPIDLKSDTIDARIYRAFPKEGFVISREIFDSISKDATNKPVTLNSFNSALNALFNRGIINATSIKKVPPAQKKPEWKQYIKTKYAYSRLAPAELRTRFLIGSNDENHG